jgi:DNA-directed RNA polymerase specialized sigma24 family protein
MNEPLKPELSKSLVLTQLFGSKEVSDVLKKINPSYIREDVKQHVFLILFEKEEAFIIDLYTRGKLKGYVAKTLYNTANYSQSSFNRELRRATEIPTSSFDGENTTVSWENDEQSPGVMKHVDRVAREAMEYTENQQERYDYEALVETCSLKLDQIYWYNRDMLRLYVKLGSYRAVSKETGIPTRSVYDAVKKAKEDMKKLLWE